jgi:general secretion pathway protein A
MNELIDLIKPSESRPSHRTLQPLRNESEKPPSMFEHFGFSVNPFSDAVNPDFFYETDQHERAYLRLMATVEQDISLALLTGQSGTGKTLLSQLVLKNLDPDRYVPILVLVTPKMSKTAMLREILIEAGIKPPERQCFTNTMIGLLSDYIISLHRQGRKLVIFIDECHFLSAESLHTLRTLSNIEIPEKKLLTCILLSEPRILTRLRHPNYEAIRGRIYMETALEKLSREDTEQYIKLRLLQAGGRDDLFDASGLLAAYMCSGGICRLINKVCACAMMEAYLEREHTITSSHVGKGAGQCMSEIKTSLRQTPVHSAGTK